MSIKLMSAVWERLELDPYERLVSLSLADHADDDGLCYPSVARLEDPKAKIHLLLGHSYDKPLASKLTGGLVLRDSDEALAFDAEIAPEIAETSYFRDFFAGFMAGLVVGLSPGFRIPPPSAVPSEEAERVEEEDPAEGRAIIRTILQALLWRRSAS
ncbi:helix-turn-helix domain-containing protein [Amaricoccus sp.]|uniref:helix-turn-helix domain-containing protein n=1 Tax=Amaricoccus sp. TaxID=1872485 RepID=UPI0026148DD3|nr:helix-turn-helix domain-containing protein [Amaricoccus sp.]HRO13303.1 hypothetical protein [Amaricoccus sp.]